MKQLIRLIAIIATIGAVPERLTLQQIVDDFWLVNGYGWNEYAIWAAQYIGPEPVWGNIGGEWVYRGMSDRYHFARGRATRTVDVRTKATLKNNVWIVEEQTINERTEIIFLPSTNQVTPIVPSDANTIIWIPDPPEPVDPNMIAILQLEEFMQDPNNIRLGQGLLDLVEGEMK